MEKLNDLVADLVKLSGGELTGRIRFQKIIYLMDQKGLGSGANYTYYHYGPYSENVTDAISDAKFWGKLVEETEFRQSDGAPYSVFKATIPHGIDRLGQLDAAIASALLDKLKPVNSTVLELAATTHWLTHVEHVSDWKSEIERRKPGKTENGRLEKAVALLGELGLGP